MLGSSNCIVDANAVDSGCLLAGPWPTMTNPDSKVPQSGLVEWNPCILVRGIQTQASARPELVLRVRPGNQGNSSSGKYSRWALMRSVSTIVYGAMLSLYYVTCFD